MKRELSSTILFVSCLLTAQVTGGRSPQGVNPASLVRAPRRAQSWFKGNLHTHTLRSDGDSTPEQVAAWYRDHGYDFLVVTDHNRLAPASMLNARFGADGQFLVVQGEEVTDESGGQPIHVNALGVSEAVAPQHGLNTVDVMRRDAAAIRQAGGLAVLNHPNFMSPIGSAALAAVQGAGLFELFNGNPITNSRGPAGQVGLEDQWDDVLSTGRLMYGVAADDAHVFGTSPGPRAARGGQGWVYVHAAQLAPRSILQALAAGDFYSSTGVELTSYDVSELGISVEVNAQASHRYRVTFIGLNGRVLETVDSSTAFYSFEGDETYVRVRIEDSNGTFAWTQPIRPADVY